MPVEKKLIVTAPFEIVRNYKTVSYKKDDEFKIPEDWTRNPERVNAFSVPKPVLDEKGNLKYMDSRLIILPLKEA
jgi:hypothetical protein